MMGRLCESTHPKPLTCEPSPASAGKLVEMTTVPIPEADVAEPGGTPGCLTGKFQATLRPWYRMYTESHQYVSLLSFSEWWASGGNWGFIPDTYFSDWPLVSSQASPYSSVSDSVVYIQVYIFKRFTYFYIIYVNVMLTRIYHVCRVPTETGEAKSLGTRVTGSGQLPCECWESNSGPLQEHQSPESSAQLWSLTYL